MGKIIKIISLILITGSISIPISYKVGEEIIIKENDKKIEEALENEYYYAILEIPSINLRKEIFKVNDPNNNVDINLMLHKESIMPDNTNSQVIILGHSGSGIHGYFKELYKLKINNLVNLYYKGYIYTYEIKYIEKQDKTGTLYLNKKYPEMITLITCTKNDKNTQTIYYGKLKNKEKL